MTVASRSGMRIGNTFNYRDTNRPPSLAATWCRAHIPFPNGGSLGGMLCSEVCALAAELGRCMVSLSAFPLPKGGPLGGTLWSEVCALEPALGRCMVSLLALPFPNGGSLGGMLWFEVCAIAPTENTEANAAAKRNFFTIFSEVFRLHRIGPCMARTSVPTTI